MDEHISFFICDDNDNNLTETVCDFNISADHNNFDENNTCCYDADIYMSRTLNYETNFTVKELMLIAEYYGLAKNLKKYKATKTDIIISVVNYELDPQNFEKVAARERMWYYINELKNDDCMKKYVLWN